MYLLSHLCCISHYFLIYVRQLVFQTVFHCVTIFQDLLQRVLNTRQPILYSAQTNLLYLH